MMVARPVGEGIPTPDHLNAMRLTAGPRRSQLAAPCLIQPAGVFSGCVWVGDRLHRRRSVFQGLPRP